MAVIREIAKKFLVGSPLEIPARWVDYALTGNKNFLYDRQTFEVMRRVLRLDSSFVDVGCHKGDILREAVRLAPDGQHWAFEPLPDFYISLRNSFPEVNLFNVALSDRSESTVFNRVSAAPALSSIQARDDIPAEQMQQFRIRTETLDSIVKGRVDLIKIDVEGAAFLVLCGAAKTIIRDKPVIVFECGLGPAADSYGHTPEQYFDLLADCGLRLSTMKRWLRNGEGFGRHQFCEHYHAGRDYYFIASA